MKICKKCETLMGDLASYCVNCGYKLPFSFAQVELAEEDEQHRMIVCGEQGHALQRTLKDGGNFCGKCGKLLQPPTFH